MKLAVFAYHNIGYECLKVLLEANEEIVAVVTHEDDPREEIWFSSVAELGRQCRVPVYAPSNPNTPDFIALMRSLAPELLFSFYYRQLLSNELLAIPPLGGINLHGSLLPKYRGRSPVNWVLINGETETGVTLHYMIDKADAGDIIAQRPVAVDLQDTVLTLFRKMTTAAAQLLRETYPLLKNGAAPRIPQDSSQATKFGGRRPEDGKVVWEKSSVAIYNLIRAVTHPYPGAFTFHAGKKIFLWGATIGRDLPTASRIPPGTIEAGRKGGGMLISTGDGSLHVTQAQIEQQEEMEAGELVERYRIPVGSRMG
jgi:methionyl-tRNA formyltransferase